MRYIICALSLFLISFLAQANMNGVNSTRFQVGFDRNISFAFQTIEFDNNTETNALTSTVGLHVGIQVPIATNTYMQFTPGILLNGYVNKTFSSNGGSTSSSGSFNVKYLSLRLNHDFPTKKKNLKLRVSFGADYNFPGNFRAVRNGVTVDGFSYGNSVGYQGRIGLLVGISKFQGLFSAGFRKMSFDLESYARGDIADLDISMINLKAHSLTLGFDFFF
ncbi:MAG: hypothetical protein JXR10_10015 [Cyclobacteriaceae bacterium]